MFQYTNLFQFVIIVDGVDELDIQNLDVRSGDPFFPQFLYFHDLLVPNQNEILM